MKVKKAKRDGSSSSDDSSDSGSDSISSSTTGSSSGSISSSSTSSRDSSSSSSSIGSETHKKTRKRKHNCSSSSKYKIGTEEREQRKTYGHKMKKVGSICKKLKRKKVKSKKKKAEPDPMPAAVDPVADDCSDVPVSLRDRSRNLGPLTKEDHEKQQREAKRVFNEMTGRITRLKGNSEAIEDIVSRKRQQIINKQATKADGNYFQATVNADLLDK